MVDIDKNTYIFYDTSTYRITSTRIYFVRRTNFDYIYFILYFILQYITYTHYSCFLELPKMIFQACPSGRTAIVVKLFSCQHIGAVCVRFQTLVFL